MKQCLALVAALVPIAAYAQNDFGALRYDYLATTLVFPETDEIGIELEGSIAATEKLVVFGRYRDFEPIKNLNQKSREVGVGRIFRIRPNLDFMPSLSFADNDIDRPARAAVNKEGLIIGGHVRGWMTARVELAASVMLDHSKGSSTDSVVEFGLQYFRQPTWSFGGRLRDDDNDTTLYLGTRFYFGPSRRPLGQ